MRSPVSPVQLSPSASDFQTHVPYSFLSIALLSLPLSTSVLLRSGTQSLANATPPWSRPSSSHRASRKLRVLERSCCSLRQSRPLSLRMLQTHPYSGSFVGGAPRYCVGPKCTVFEANVRFWNARVSATFVVQSPFFPPCPPQKPPSHVALVLHLPTGASTASCFEYRRALWHGLWGAVS